MLLKGGVFVFPVIAVGEEGHEDGDKVAVEKLETLTALVTNDTGTMHLADFLGVPLVSIFGSTEPDLTGPRNDKSVVIRHRVECSPCFLRDCPVDFRCMAAVTPEEVSSRVLELVNGGQ